jgi:hypothetical protein
LWVALDRSDVMFMALANPGRPHRPDSRPDRRHGHRRARVLSIRAQAASAVAHTGGLVYPTRSTAAGVVPVMELLVAFALFYLLWLLAARVVREIVGNLRLLAWLLTRPLLWLAHRQAHAAQRHRQRARTMQELRELALPPGGGSR